MELPHISSAELNSALGELYPAFRYALPARRPCLVPDWKQLKPGDVILTASRNNRALDPVYQFQRLAAGMADETAKWSHVMIYLGDLQVAESNRKSRDPDLSTVVSGTRIRNLGSFVAECDMQICRLPDKDFSQEQRLEAVDYARHDIASRPRKYALDRLFEMATNLKIRSPEQAAESVICTDLVLQILAVGGAVMVEDHARHSAAGRGMLPAHFCLHKRLEQIPMPYYVLDD